MIKSGSSTFERRLENRRRFEGEEQFLSVLAEGPTLFDGHDELTNEACTVTNVVVLVVFGQVEDILCQKLGLQEGERGDDWR